jgi:hypothetical protein
MKLDLKEDIIVSMLFGSHLYGTNTPKSDMDYKGVFMPTKEAIYLSRVNKSYTFNTKKGSQEKNEADDKDIEMYSLHYFIKLACEGQTVALDMLYAPDNMLINTSLTWAAIRQNREKFLTKNLKAFIGYARRQAAKYGIKGSRLAACKKVMEIIDGVNHTKLTQPIMYHVWDQLPEEEHLHHLGENENGVRQYQVCGKIIQEKVSLGNAYEMLKKFHDNYGERARKAEANEGIDWKAVSHAMRAAFQLKELLTDHTITFPLREAEYLKKIKSGELHFVNQVNPTLETLMDEVEELSKKSDLPEKVNRNYWDRFIVETVGEVYG